jgi:hydroxypyruvate reductase 1
MSTNINWTIYNPEGRYRVIVTKNLPGDDWLTILENADCRIEVNLTKEVISKKELIKIIGDQCIAVIGQLTESWDSELFRTLKSAGGVAYCNYAVGYNNVDIDAASFYNIKIANTPEVLTETTAEMAVALTLTCARRIVEADGFTRAKKFENWLPDLFLGKGFWRGTLGIIGAGRIGISYAMMMVQAFQMDLIYTSNRKNEVLENQVLKFNTYLNEMYNYTVSVKYTNLDDVLANSDVVSIHTPLNKQTHHLITASSLAKMKNNAVLINTSRGAVIDEAALANHCKKHLEFKAGLDVFEFEPSIHEDLLPLSNVVLTPHIASATHYTREAMARISALNIVGIINQYPIWEKESIDAFLNDEIPKAIPSVINF